MAKAAPNASAPDLAATAVPDPVSRHRARSFLTSLTSGLKGMKGWAAGSIIGRLYWIPIPPCRADHWPTDLT